MDPWFSRFCGRLRGDKRALPLEAAAAVDVDAVAHELPCTYGGRGRGLCFGGGHASTRMARLRGPAVAVLLAGVAAKLWLCQSAGRHGRGRCFWDRRAMGVCGCCGRPSCGGRGRGIALALDLAAAAEKQQEARHDAKLSATRH